MWRILWFILFFVIDTNAHAQNIDIQLKTIEQQEDKAKAISELNSLLQSNALSNAQRIEALRIQSRSYLSLSELKAALVAIHKAKALANQENLLLSEAQADKLIGIILYYQGEYDESLHFYKASLAYFKKQLFTSDIAIKQANLLNNIALVQTSQGDAFAALKTYQELEPLYQRYGDEIDKIDVRYNLATLYISLRRYDIAIDMLQEVILGRKSLKDFYGLAKAEGDLGVSYKYSGEYHKAEKNHLSALEYFQKHDHQIEVASQLHNLSEVYYELSLLDKAIHYATLGAKTSESTGHQMSYAGCLQVLGKVFFHLGDVEGARKNIELSISIAQKMGFQRLINVNLGLMSLIYAAENKKAKALDAQLKFQQQSLQLSNETLNEKLAAFESDQLLQQVKNLQQGKKLQQLEANKAEQQRHFIVLLVVFLLVVLFLVYRRYLESSLTRELEDRVKQRTEALEFLTEELKDANTIKSQFLANMSHEIRTPLTAVLGQAEAVIHGDFDEGEIIKEVEVIHSNSLHLLQLINDILDLSKIEANKFELENRQHDLHEIVVMLNDIFTEQAQRKNLSFTITHHLTSPFIINIDCLRLKQILINLCSNAIKFTKEGWVSLDISVIDKTLFFTVTDTGIGMSEEQLGRVFNVFTQGDNSISRRFSGSGLGLFLSEQLAKVMSGNISVSSQLNQGSTFVLKLPFEEVRTPLSIIESSDSFSEKYTQNKQYEGSVLLADDHDDNRRLIARMLSSLGLNVIEATNGIEAINLYLENLPSLVLLDIQMPRMDGVQALEKLRILGCTCPIYALTANAMSHEIAQYLELGFAGHLKKPIEREVFLTAITQHFTEVNDSESPIESNIDLSELAQSFSDNLVKNKEDILKYIKCNDYKGLARAAHKIAGSAGMFGYKELSQSAAELEIAIKNDRIDIVDDLTHCLFDEISSAQHKNQKKIKQ